jgi:aspartyl-tRNA(Asn)/glutamyl-tRNA(Gln) amidotransferase subunit C
MPLSIEQVRKIAILARLKLSPEQEARFGEQLSAILAYVEQLSALDVSQVEPMTHAVDVAGALREDEVRPGLSPDAALANAPARSGTTFKVPRIIE